MNRIITHGGCADGFFVAYIFKKYFSELLGIPKDAPVIGATPKEIQNNEFEFFSGDIVLDLPVPQKEVKFWCDHHETSNSVEKENYYFKKAKSCTGFLIDIAKEKGIELSEEVYAFRKVVDQMDNADYTEEDIRQTYYLQENYDNMSDLQKANAIAAMIRTRDYQLNSEIANEIFSHELAATPLSDEKIWKMNPVVFYKARLNNFAAWREWVDKFIYYNEDLTAGIQDDRNVKTYPRGIPDRFYVFMKYPQALFGISINPFGRDLSRIGITTNIFKKDQISVNVGQLCAKLGREFGNGAGGGHKLVGSTVVKREDIDNALKVIKEEILNNETTT